MKRSLIITLALIAAIAVPLCASSGWARGLGVLALGGGAPQALRMSSAGSDDSANYTTESVVTDNQSTIYIRAKLKFDGLGSTPVSDTAIRLVRIDGTRGMASGIAVLYDISDAKWYLVGRYYDETLLAASHTGFAEYTLGTEVVAELKLYGSGYEFRVNGTVVDSATKSIYGDFDGITLSNKLPGTLVGGYEISMYNNATVVFDCVDVSSSEFLGTNCATVGNLLHETFDGTGYSNVSGWTETIGAGDTIDEDYTP